VILSHNTLNWSPFLQATPNFILGILLARRMKSINVSDPMKLILFFSVVFFWIISPIFEIDLGLVSVLTRIKDLFFLSITLIFFSSLEFHNRLDTFSKFLGARSYAFYAVHSPLLLAYGYFIEELVSIRSVKLEIAYFAAGLCLVVIASDFLYRTIDCYALKFSRKVKFHYEKSRQR